MIDLAAVERVVERALTRYRLLVERVSDLVFSDQAATGKGAQGQDVGCEVAGMYGFQSRPPDGGDGIIVKFDGRAQSALLVGYRHRTYELKLEKGEVALVDQKGQVVHLKPNGVTIDVSKNVGAKVEVLTDPTGATVIKGGQVLLGGTTGASPTTLALNAQTLDPVTGVPLQPIGNTKTYLGDIG
jgi:phage gp45-like